MRFVCVLLAMFLSRVSSALVFECHSQDKVIRVSIINDQCDLLLSSGSVSVPVTWIKGSAEMRIVRGRDHAGPVGTRFVLSDIYSKAPKLTEFNFGGFTGPIQIGQFTCVHP